MTTTKARKTVPIAAPLQGFEVATKTEHKRVILSIQGREKMGKTRFSLTAPDPIALINLDIGDEGIVDQFIDSKVIYKQDYRARRSMTQDDYVALWEKLKNDYYNAIDSELVRTIVLDTGTDAWDLARLARLGKLTQVMPHNYVEVNNEFKEMIKEAHTSIKNVIFLHQVKDEYVANQTTGNQIRAGFSKIGYLVQANLELYTDRDDNGEDVFCCRFIDSRHNPALKGIILKNNDISFSTTARMILPDTTEDDWE